MKGMVIIPEWITVEACNKLCKKYLKENISTFISYIGAIIGGIFTTSILLLFLDADFSVWNVIILDNSCLGLYTYKIFHLDSHLKSTPVSSLFPYEAKTTPALGTPSKLNVHPEIPWTASESSKLKQYLYENDHLNKVIITCVQP